MLSLSLQALSEQFPRSDWIVAQAATAQYSLRNFDDAQELFEDLLERDPERVEVSTAPCCGVLCGPHRLCNWKLAALLETFRPLRWIALQHAAWLPGGCAQHTWGTARAFWLYDP